MIYPSRAVAGLVAEIVMTHFAQKHITIKSFSGLGLNEQFLILAPTTFGKEDVRNVLLTFDRYINHPESTYNQKRHLNNDCISHLAYAFPASMQGLHRHLEDNRAHTFLADEYAEWLRQTKDESHKQATLGYSMECYTKAGGIVCPPNTADNKYTPVKNPRLTVVATSTESAMLGAMTSDHAESGAYNRLVIMVAERDGIEKRYEGQDYKIPEAVLECISWVQSLPDNTVMTFDKEAWEFFKTYDHDYAEPLKKRDSLLAGRLSEQSMKTAGKIALSDKRLIITAEDLQTAYGSRLGNYHRVSDLIIDAGSLSGMHPTGKAKAQLQAAFRRFPTIYRSQLHNFSRQYEKLSMQEQGHVLASLCAEGSIKNVTGKIIISNIFDILELKLRQ
jgi:hypothetical protein